MKLFLYLPCLIGGVKRFIEAIPMVMEMQEDDMKLGAENDPSTMFMASSTNDSDLHDKKNTNFVLEDGKQNLPRKIVSKESGIAPIINSSMDEYKMDENQTPELDNKEKISTLVNEGDSSTDTTLTQISSNNIPSNTVTSKGTVSVSDTESTPDKNGVELKKTVSTDISSATNTIELINDIITESDITHHPIETVNLIKNVLSLPTTVTTKTIKLMHEVKSLLLQKNTASLSDEYKYNSSNNISNTELEKNIEKLLNIDHSSLMQSLNSFENKMIERDIDNDKKKYCKRCEGIR